MRSPFVKGARNCLTLLAVATVACASAPRHPVSRIVRAGGQSHEALTPTPPSPSPTNTAVARATDLGDKPKPTVYLVPAQRPAPRMISRSDETPTGSIPDLIRSVFGAHGEKAVRIARCESRFDPHAVNGSHRGVFQVSEGHWDGRWGGPVREFVHGYRWDDMWDAESNIRWTFAHTKGGRDWSEWECK